MTITSLFLTHLKIFIESGLPLDLAWNPTGLEQRGWYEIYPGFISLSIGFYKGFQKGFVIEGSKLWLRLLLVSNPSQSLNQSNQ